MPTYRYIGAAHPFYQYGESYTLHIHKTLFGRIRIWTERGKSSVIDRSRARYRNEVKFNEDWVKQDGK
jgi:hypothetical protein